MSLLDAGELLALDYMATQITYIGLSTTTPAEGGTNITEPVAMNYARQPIAFHAAGSGAMTNDGLIDFGTTTGAWGTLTHWVGYSAIAGTALFFGTITPNKTVGSGDSVTIPDATLSITAD
jgi:hypothetical protein